MAEDTNAELVVGQFEVNDWTCRKCDLSDAAVRRIASELPVIVQESRNGPDDVTQTHL